jgi:hypothetical protein
LGDDNISGVNVLGVGDEAIGKGFRPFFRPFPEFVLAVECNGPSIVSVDEALGGILDDAWEVAFVPALVCGAEHFYVLRSHGVPPLSLKERKVGRATLGLALSKPGYSYAAFSKAIL